MFQCQGCNFPVRKSALKSHIYTCKMDPKGDLSAIKFTCLKCEAQFTGRDYMAHTSCTGKAESEKADDGDANKAENVEADDGDAIKTENVKADDGDAIKTEKVEADIKSNDSKSGEDKTKGKKTKNIRPVRLLRFNTRMVLFKKAIEESSLSENFKKYLQPYCLMVPKDPRKFEPYLAMIKKEFQPECQALLPILTEYFGKYEKKIKEVLKEHGFDEYGHQVKKKKNNDAIKDEGNIKSASSEQVPNVQRKRKRGKGKNTPNKKAIIDSDVSKEVTAVKSASEQEVKQKRKRNKRKRKNRENGAAVETDASKVAIVKLEAEQDAKQKRKLNKRKRKNTENGAAVETDASKVAIVKSAAEQGVKQKRKPGKEKNTANGAAGGEAVAKKVADVKSTSPKQAVKQQEKGKRRKGKKLSK